MASGRADGRPERITPANIVPEAEDTRLVDAEGLGCLGIGRKRSQMGGHIGLTERLHQPGANGFRVGQRLQRGEGLRGDQNQRALRIESRQNVRRVGAIDIGNEMDRRTVAKRGQRPNRHGRSKVRPANPDIDHMGERVTIRCGNRARSNVLGKPQKTRFFRFDFLLCFQWCPRSAAQRCVQHRAVLGGVDRLTAQHRLTLADHVVIFR
jgi:hypothetical protein